MGRKAEEICGDGAQPKVREKEPLKVKQVLRVCGAGAGKGGGKRGQSRAEGTTQEGTTGERDRDKRDTQIHKQIRRGRGTPPWVTGELVGCG